MGDFLQNAAAALPFFIPRQTVVYRQGGVAISIQTTAGRSMVEYEGEDGVRLQSEMRNYLIERSELAIDGKEIQPREGDTITDDQDGTTEIYIVASDGGSSWRWVNRYHKQYRVIVQERSEVAV